MYGSYLQSEKCMLDFNIAVNELKRVLKTGGRMFITIPFGRRQKIICGGTIFMQQFDRTLLASLKHTLTSCEIVTKFYQYSQGGWNISNEDSCSNVAYFNIHKDRTFDNDFAAAARAVACLEIIKR